jgi:hypothetical protein
MSIARGRRESHHRPFGMIKILIPNGAVVPSAHPYNRTRARPAPASFTAGDAALRLERG